MIENVLIQVLRLVVVDQENQTSSLYFSELICVRALKVAKYERKKNPHLRQLSLNIFGVKLWFLKSNFRASVKEEVES